MFPAEMLLIRGSCSYKVLLQTSVYCSAQLRNTASARLSKGNSGSGVMVRSQDAVKTDGIEQDITECISATGTNMKGTSAEEGSSAEEWLVTKTGAGDAWCTVYVKDLPVPEEPNLSQSDFKGQSPNSFS